MTTAAITGTNATTTQATDASQTDSSIASTTASVTDALSDFSKANCQPQGNGSSVQQMIQMMQSFVSMFMNMMQTMMGLIGKEGGSAIPGSTTPGTTTPGSTTPGSTTPGTTTPGTTTPGTTTPGTTTPGTTTPSETVDKLVNLKLGTDAKQLPEITTKDGWKVNLEGANEGWSITDPEGKATRIWGDPHVNESDGDTFDFKDQSTFMFGNNKVTVETTPAGNGQFFTKNITIYSGNERITITGIDGNKPSVEAAKLDGKADDAKRMDGDVYRMRDSDYSSAVDKDWQVVEAKSTK